MRSRTSISQSPPSLVTRSISPIRTSRAALAGWPLDWIRPSSQARAASDRVLKNLAAHNHLSIRTEVIIHFHLFSDTDGIYVETWVAADCFGRGGVSITGECGWWDEM